jgi:hypothetical protein
MSKLTTLSRTLLLTSLTWAATTTTSWAAGVIQVSENKEISLGLLLQPTFSMDEVLKSDDSVDHWTKSAYLRRARIMIAGQYTKHVFFFAETDNPNFGKGADWSGNTFIQDAWMEFNTGESLQVDLGMLLLPFSHQGEQGATSLNAIDYHSGLIKYPDGSNKIWRDSGVMVRGLLAKKRVEYRLSMTNGVEGGTAFGSKVLNENDAPRFTGRLQFNGYDAEGGPGAKGFFYKGIYIEKEDKKVKNTKKVLSVAGSFDYQANAALDAKSNKVVDYVALSGDVFLDMPLQNKVHDIVGQADFYHYSYGDGNVNTGWGVASELGYRVDKIEPLVVFDIWNAAGLSDASAEVNNAGDTKFVGLGLNWWYQAHAANLKWQVGMRQTLDGDDSTDEPWVLGGIMQGQLLF